MTMTDEEGTLHRAYNQEAASINTQRNWFMVGTLSMLFPWKLIMMNERRTNIPGLMQAES